MIGPWSVLLGPDPERLGRCPERCAARLAATAKRTGIRRFLLMVEGAGAPGYALETIGRLGAEVGPLVS